ncbi:nitroreductase family deazaflavin-dependent oxidoreductase [Nocardia uniformis]|uniref:Nitroreductase family deazaflavin-dependent oxidoreductase n=2 Tax=Nocardia uniformis TaxID=53432 RepID=A0A849CAJ1_9NOCA|nr:nitroreductase family deazaflavin-dependent oxidoreductase [Nocardia uniformis]
MNRRMNGAVVALIDAPVIGRLMGRGFVVITYVGRRSGKTISTPVNYRRKGDTLTIGVAMADKKTWWRNFLGEGGPISLHLNGVDRTGHAVARRDERGRVTVKVQLAS